MVDDTGTGDLLGNAFIVFWRRETNEFMVKTIPLECYQAADFNEKSKQLVKQHFIEAIEQMKILPTEEFLICQGPIFDDARAYLTEQKFTFQSIKIEGELQDRVEEVYITYIVEEFGVPKEIIPKEGGKDRFFALFNWIVQDFPRRSRFVKSGFEKWQTKWVDEAKNAWMHQMVSTPIRKNFDSDSEDNILENESSNRPINERRQIHSSSKKRGTLPKHGRGFQKRGGSPNNKIRKRSGSPKGRGKNFSEDHRKRSTDKKYSSTDPDPRRKFF